MLLIWTFRDNLQWIFNGNSNIFIQENAFDNVVCEIPSIIFGLNVSLATDQDSVKYHINAKFNMIRLLLNINIVHTNYYA